MIDRLILPPAVHMGVGTLVLVSNLILLLVAGRLAWQKKPFTSAANLIFVLFQLSLMLQALAGIKLLDQGLGVLQLYIHYLGGLAPLAFCLLFYWFPTADTIAQSRRVAILSSLSFFFVLLTFSVGSTYSARLEAGASGSTAAERGASLYTTCAGCHGASGEGISGSGVNLANNEFVSSRSDSDLVAFIKAGRAADDPQNKTGILMPSLGGNLSLTEPDLYDIVAFLRTLPQ
ncbi:MAG: c-type cytochrome [Ardenticatenaceae bacterium]